MELYMGSLQIRCGFKKCAWKGDLENYSSHLLQCPAKMLERHRADQRASAIELVTLRTTLQRKDTEIEDLTTKLGSSQLQVANVNAKFETAIEEIRSKQTKIFALVADTYDLDEKTELKE
jgi:hypothetical protein